MKNLVSCAPDSFGKESGNFSRVSVCWCWNVDTTINTIGNDCKVNYILEVGSTRMTIAPGKVSLFWPNESCTKRYIRSSKNYVNCVHVTLTYTSSNCILPAHRYTAKVTRLYSKRVWRVRDYEKPSILAIYSSESTVVLSM